MAANTRVATRRFVRWKRKHDELAAKLDKKTREISELKEFEEGREEMKARAWKLLHQVPQTLRPIIYM